MPVALAGTLAACFCLGWHELKRRRERSHGDAARPALFFLGDSRSRYTLATLAPHVCAPSLDCHYPQVCALAGKRIVERTQGIVTCERGANLSAIGYMLHYGVAPARPYHSAPGHYDERAARRGSLELMRAGLRRFRSIAKDAPIFVCFSSLVWDLGRRLVMGEKQQEGARSEAWTHEYATNMSRAVKGIQAQLDASRGDRLLLIADYGCSSPEPLCRLWGGETARAAAAAIASIGRHLELPVVDLEEPFRHWLRTILHPQRSGGNSSELTFLHPSREASCIQWAAMRAAWRDGNPLNSTRSSPSAALLPVLPPVRACGTWCRRLKGHAQGALRDSCASAALPLHGHGGG